MHCQRIYIFVERKKERKKEKERKEEKEGRKKERGRSEGGRVALGGEDSDREAKSGKEGKHVGT